MTVRLTHQREGRKALLLGSFDGVKVDGDWRPTREEHRGLRGSDLTREEAETLEFSMTGDSDAPAWTERQQAGPGDDSHAFRPRGRSGAGSDKRYTRPCCPCRPIRARHQATLQLTQRFFLFQILYKSVFPREK
jgi:hypothetical protein